MKSKTSNGVIDNARDGTTRITFQGAIGTTEAGVEVQAHTLAMAISAHKGSRNFTVREAEAQELEQGQITALMVTTIERERIQKDIQSRTRTGGQAIRTAGRTMVRT
jgi:hypothetical protein